MSAPELTLLSKRRFGPIFAGSGNVSDENIREVILGLFSVNSTTAAGVPRLFARNERVLTLWDSAAGRFALVMVGARVMR